MIWIKVSAKWINVNVIDTICSSPDWNQFICAFSLSTVLNFPDGASLFYFNLCPLIYTCSFLCVLKCVTSKYKFIYIYIYVWNIHMYENMYIHYILNISFNYEGKWKLYRQDYADTQ